MAAWAPWPGQTKAGVRGCGPAGSRGLREGEGAGSQHHGHVTVTSWSPRSQQWARFSRWLPPLIREVLCRAIRVLGAILMLFGNDAILPSLVSAHLCESPFPSPF